MSTSDQIVESTILLDVTDRTKHCDEPGLYVLLDRIPLGGAASRAATPVSWADLTGSPSAHRGMLVTVAGRMVESTSLRLSNRLRQPEPVHSSILVGQDSGNPLQIITIEAPRGLRTGDTVTATGYYLKYRRDQPAGGPATVEILVPVVVARKIALVDHPGRGEDVGSVPGSVLAAIGVLATVYFVVRWRSRDPADRPYGRRRRPASLSSDTDPVDLDAWSDGGHPDDAPGRRGRK